MTFLQAELLHTLQQLMNGVEVEVGQLTTLDLGLDGSHSLPLDGYN